MLWTLIDRRMAEARKLGEALARRVLVETLGSKEVRLALAVLREGTDADHPLVDCARRYWSHRTRCGNVSRERGQEGKRSMISARRCGRRG